MTVKLVNSIKTFIGFSTDTKPTDCPVGSTFHEMNTGSDYIFTGNEWVDESGGTTTTSGA